MNQNRTPKWVIYVGGLASIATILGVIIAYLSYVHPTNGSSPGVTVTTPPSGNLPSTSTSGNTTATLTPSSQPSPTPSSTTTVAAGITGTWEGKGVEGGGHPFTDTLSLTQTGNSITGTSNTQHQTVTSSGTITGDISGNSVKLTVYDAACTKYYELTLSQDRQSLNGYYLGCGVINKQTIELAKR